MLHSCYWRPGGATPWSRPRPIPSPNRGGDPFRPEDRCDIQFPPGPSVGFSGSAWFNCTPYQAPILCPHLPGSAWGGPTWGGGGMLMIWGMASLFQAFFLAAGAGRGAQGAGGALGPVGSPCPRPFGRNPGAMARLRKWAEPPVEAPAPRPEPRRSTPAPVPEWPPAGQTPDERATPILPPPPPTAPVGGDPPGPPQAPSLDRRLGVSPVVLERMAPESRAILDELPGPAAEAYRNLTAPERRKLARELEGTSGFLFIQYSNRESFITGRAGDIEVFPEMLRKLDESLKKGKLDAAGHARLTATVREAGGLSPVQREAVVLLLEAEKGV